MLNPDAIKAQIVSTIYDPFPRFPNSIGTKKESGGGGDKNQGFQP
jgi:hypothetical protein